VLPVRTRATRQLSLPVSMMSQWWVRRSSNAVVILASLKTLGHSPIARNLFDAFEAAKRGGRAPLQHADI
jgi:hypothetical protein